MAKETAEQKLLKILEESGHPQSPKSAPVRAPRSPLKVQFSVKLLNALLMAGIVVCLAVFALEIKSGVGLLHQQVDISLDDSMGHRVSDAVVPKPKDIAYYASNFSVRNIFKPYDKELLDRNKTVAKPDLDKKLSKYKLVGVAWLDLPESVSVMIEDTATGMTYFLREGEKLDDVTVKTIYTDRAVLRYENEEITIKL